MWSPGPFELIIILVIIVLIFGVGKLPTAAKELGSGFRNFQKSLRGEDEDEDEPAKQIEQKKEEKATPAEESEEAAVEK